MEEIYQNLSILNQWGSDSSNETSFDVTELWLEDASGKIKPRHQTVEAGGVHRWLSQHKKGFGDQAQSLVMRFVWVDVDVKDKVIRLSDSVRDVLLDNFGLKLAYGYSRSVISGVTAFPLRPSDPDFDQRTYSFCYIPKIASIWSHRRSTKPDGPAPVTQCIMFVQGDERKALKQGLQVSWDLSIYRNPMFPAFALSLLLGAQIDQSNGGIKVQLRKVEKRTGYSTFASRQGEEAATEELGNLSAQTSGSAAKLASTMRKTKTLERLLDFILKMVDEDESRLRLGAANDTVQNDSIDPVSQSALDGCELLKTHVDLLKERQKNQLLDTEYILKRVQVQIDALFSIITQQDSLHSLKLSQSTHEIAYFSYRDSSSMKTLAVVTMFFLPGSFISALFSTPCFEWASVDHLSNDIGVKPTPQFSLYCAIAIPLTVVTFMLYFLWLWVQKREKNRIFSAKAAQLQTDSDGDRDIEEAEGYSLARTRRQTLMARRHSAFSSFAHK
ncbi:Uncharacterized protein TPAR_05130 [Tolypocladium paradoxum]|uniref:Uncharacterized protein n=1 Tax=Tolypocladium paradoxum TaxID=94208 RepID=A0A2S4KWX1_9HYPO|nr:Uncharacterized protein TPAR_05130 [Tolypocladium paradoxum]